MSRQFRYGPHAAPPPEPVPPSPSPSPPWQHQHQHQHQLPHHPHHHPHHHHPHSHLLPPNASTSTTNSTTAPPPPPPPPSAKALPPVLVQDPNLSPSTNTQPRFSDVSTGPPTPTPPPTPPPPSPHPLPPPPATAPSLPPTPRPSVDHTPTPPSPLPLHPHPHHHHHHHHHHHQPSSQHHHHHQQQQQLHNATNTAHLPHSLPQQHNLSHTPYNAQPPPQDPLPPSGYRRADMPPLRPPLPSNNFNAGTPYASFSIPNRLTATEPAHHAPFKNANIYSPSQQSQPQPQHRVQGNQESQSQAASKTQSSVQSQSITASCDDDLNAPVMQPVSSNPSTPRNNPPSRPHTPSEGEPTSSKLPSDHDAASAPASSVGPSTDHEQQRLDHHDSNPLSESRASDVLLSSAEPASINAAASTHINAAGLEYDFDNIDTRIGVGTYGSVYLGQYFNAHVAIKRIRIPSATPGIADDPYVSARHADAIREFAREIRRYERVNHPGIVRFFGVTLTPDPAALLITEFMQGGSLGEAISVLRRSSTPFQLESAVRIAMQSCGGLRALHTHGCTWGDAKPENILLSEAIDADGVFPPSAEARIADFGLSRSVGQTLLGETTIAGSGTPAGTYNYMAPETFSGVDHDRKAKAADIYSFGMVMYEMLTLRTPFKRRQLAEVYEAVRRGERPAWPACGDSDFCEVIPQELQDIVQRCWHQDPQKRPTAEGVFVVLQRYIDSMADRPEQRPVTDLNRPGNTVAPDLMQPTSIAQATVSTVVPIGDTSDLGSNMLESTTESRRMFDVPDEGDENDDTDCVASATAPVNKPTVSPVTSPESRQNKPPLLDDPAISAEGSDWTKSQLTPVQPSAGTTSYFDGTKKVGMISPKQGQDLLLQSREGLPTSMELRVNNNATKAGNSVDRQDDNLRLSNMSTAEFCKHKTMDLFVHDTAQQVARMMDNDDGGLGVTHSGDWMNSLASGAGQSTLTNTIVTGEGEGELTSSNASSASLRRKRSKRLQQIIEQAAAAFIELRRREQKLPPKQRKEAAEKRAEEEARINSEKEALAVIDSAKESGNFSTVLNQMKMHRKSQTVIKASAAVIETFCREESVYFDLCEEGGIEEMVSGASLHGAADEGLAICFCHSMQYLSQHFDDKVGHMVRGLGAPTLVIELLEQHKTNVEVQTAGCECLAVIAGSSELSRSAVATLGGPSAVYKAMTKNNSSFKDIGLARAALKAIRSIAQDNEKAAEYLVQVAALDTVSRAAEVFTDHGLEKDILMALRAFAFYDEGRRNVIMSSGLKALTAIMLRNKEPEFLVQCCTFIRAIARWRDHECEEAMLQSCISERITSLMQLSNDIPGEDGAKVAWYASQACTFLASFGSRSRQRLRMVGAIETAIMILRTRKENARVVHSATDALAEMLKGEPESKRHAEGYSVVKELTEALELHGNVGRVRDALQWTLSYLSAASVPVGSGQGQGQGQQFGHGPNVYADPIQLRQGMGQNGNGRPQPAQAAQPAAKGWFPWGFRGRR